jgi:pyruvate dehydrogenase E1 component alpha subunit
MSVIQKSRLNPEGFNDYIESFKAKYNHKNKAKLSQEQLDSIFLHYGIVLKRKFEEKCSAAYRKKEIWGFCHLYIGQEAVSTGIQSVLSDKDDIITAYRCHPYMVGSGAPTFEVFSELMGRETGSSRGKGGSMHLFNTKNGFYGGHGIVGAQVSLGTGMAFAHKYKKDDGISVVLMGDGAANQGQVYESFNMAALWKLPALYVIENNGYGMGTSCARAAAGDLYKRGEPYGIKGKRINGMDVNEVRKEMQKAAEEIRKTQMPQLIECDTYRYSGHSMSDPALYREKSELKEKREADPVINSLNSISKFFNEQMHEEMEDHIASIVNKSYELAQKAAFPNTNELFTNVYSPSL